MSSPVGHIWEVVVYKSLDHVGPNFVSLAYDNCRDLPHVRYQQKFLVGRLQGGYIYFIFFILYVGYIFF